MKCQFADDGERDNAGKRPVKCQRCGHVTKPTVHDLARVFRTCPIPGWGDWLSFWIQMLTGIDKEKYTAWLRRLGISKSCGCGQRQETLNQAGWQFERFWRWLFTAASSPDPSLPPVRSQK